METKRISRNVKRRLAFFGPFILVVLVFCLVSIFSCLYRIYALKIEEKKLTVELNGLKETEKDLSVEINKLKDPNYIAKYARENYYYTKKGEYVIRIDKEKEEQKEIVISDTNKSYYLVSFCLFTLIILLLVLRIISKKK